LISLSSQLGAHWDVVDDHHLRAEYRFKDFLEALAFTNKVGELSEQEGHHPDLHLSYGKVVVTVWTHAINGLSENDFILAAKIDSLT
jgi:4a-hydroxytetrahydrobiopterin dehydratase